MYVWEYVVREEHVAEFLHTYGPDGDWVRLFRRAPGYRRTELHRDVAEPRRFVTFDYWDSEGAWRGCRARAAREWESLDARCAAWTESEREIGRFRPAP
jgi:heme-degrading monooxygenase HmoA